MEVVEGDPELECCFLNKLYTDLYMMRGGNYLTRVLELKICQNAAVCNLIFVEWHNLVIFAVLPKD